MEFIAHLQDKNSEYGQLSRKIVTKCCEMDRISSHLVQCCVFLYYLLPSKCSVLAFSFIKNAKCTRQENHRACIVSILIVGSATTSVHSFFLIHHVNRIAFYFLIHYKSVIKMNSNSILIRIIHTSCI